MNGRPRPCPFRLSFEWLEARNLPGSALQSVLGAGLLSPLLLPLVSTPTSESDFGEQEIHPLRERLSQDNLVVGSADTRTSKGDRPDSSEHRTAASAESTPELSSQRLADLTWVETPIPFQGMDLQEVFPRLDAGTAEDTSTGWPLQPQSAARNQFLESTARPATASEESEGAAGPNTVIGSRVDTSGYNDGQPGFRFLRGEQDDGPDDAIFDVLASLFTRVPASSGRRAANIAGHGPSTSSSTARTLEPNSGPVAVSTTELELTEGGSSGSFTVVLTGAPAASVTIDLTPAGSLALSPTQLTFTPASWASPQTATVTAVPVPSADGYRYASVSLALSSADPAFHEWAAPGVTVWVIDANGPSARPDHAEMQQGGAPIRIDVLSNDVSPGGSSLEITSVTAGDEGGTVVANTDGTITYTPSPSFDGTDIFRYAVRNPSGQYASTDVLVDVLPLEFPPVIEPVEDQSNAEGDYVNLQIGATGPEEGDGIYFTADSLPAGLYLDNLTGLITGHVDHIASGSSGLRSYSVQITARDNAENTSNITFTWTITDTRTAPWLEFPGALVGIVGQSANYPLAAHQDATTPPRPLSFIAMGLPAGITVNSAGVIVGVFAPGTEGEYTVTATVWDGALSSHCLDFTLTVLPAGSTLSPVQLLVNGTADTSDDITFPGTPLTVTAVGSPSQVVELSERAVLPSCGPPPGSSGGGATSLSLGIPPLTLDSTGLAVVTATPIALSAFADDIALIATVTAQLPGGGQQPLKAAEVRVTIADVALPTISRGYMPPPYEGTQYRAIARVNYDRIPPSTTSLFVVTLSVNLLLSNKAVTLDVTGQSPTNGRARLGTKDSPRDTVQVKSLVHFEAIHGTGQTAVPAGWAGQHLQTPNPNAGQLRVRASLPDGASRSSNGFSVSAWPRDLRQVAWGRTRGKRDVSYGRDLVPTPIVNREIKPYTLWFVHTWQSDSGDLRDLDQVWIGEWVRNSLGGRYPAPPWGGPNRPAGFVSVLNPTILPPVRPVHTRAGFNTGGTFVDEYILIGGALPTQGPASSAVDDQWFGFVDNRLWTTRRSEGAGADISHEAQNDLSYYGAITEVHQPDRVWVYEVSRLNPDLGRVFQLRVNLADGSIFGGEVLPPPP